MRNRSKMSLENEKLKAPQNLSAPPSYFSTAKARNCYIELIYT